MDSQVNQPQVNDVVENDYDADLGTVVAVYYDDAEVVWEDGSVTYETFDTFGPDGSWWKA